MSAHNRKLKIIEFRLGGLSYEIQLSSWKVVNNTDDGDKMWVFATGGEFIEEADPDYALELKFFSDWRSNGISDFLTTNDETDAAFQLDHLPDIVGEHVRWTGSVHIKAPTAGGDVRTTEVTEVTLQCIGKPVYSRIG
jgi:hypothetical protein